MHNLNSDLCVNLWYYLDAQTGLVFLVSGRVYALKGSHAQKRRLLGILAETDFRTAPTFPLPADLNLAETGLDAGEGLLLPEMVDLFHAEVFAPVWEHLWSNLATLGAALEPALGWTWPVPGCHLCLTTCIIEYEDGRLEPLVMPMSHPAVR
ncbi:hypothetical protein NXS98_03105 [Fontisphaera persica]|uniref:hypothetical protein n=1 Tax=Fontisphaera persica TaxID=2974023 RepID=UPI0024C0D06A|nr:hypothetical protein [Fontisphaera persica]WCJ60129.1 hypothetical protein NXS98_03105 [Fontisphaera persica]